MKRHKLLATSILFFITVLILTSCGNPPKDPQTILTVKADDWAKGPATAKVTLIEYSDFQCPACAAYEPLTARLRTDFEKDLRVVYRYFPLPSHKNAVIASRAAEAAGKQQKFWEMHDLLFQNQADWSELGNPRDTFMGYAATLGLNKDQFSNDMNDGSTGSRVDRDVEEGKTLKVQGTPTFYINGKFMQLPQGYEMFKQIVQAMVDATPDTPLPALTNGNQNSQALAYHVHADFKVYVDGKQVDFSGDQYKSDKSKHLDDYTHLHSNVGDVLHMHKAGITLEEFFQSLNVEWHGTGPTDCLDIDTTIMGCNDWPGEKKTRLYVNGKLNELGPKYVPQDLDRILITYGKEDPKTLEKELASVTDSACIYSETCPERGSPPAEDCIGGLGVPCEE